MTVDTDFTVPQGKIRIVGKYGRKENKHVEVAVYPGDILIQGTTINDVKQSDGIVPPMGYAGLEDSPFQFRPLNKTTAFSVDDGIGVVDGGDMTLYCPVGLAAKTTALKDDPLLSWSGGKHVPGRWLGGKLAVKIPFSKKTAEESTITLPAGALVRDVIIDVVTNAGGATIDVGTLSSDSGDADGFLDGESCATAGKVTHNEVDGTAANNTRGELLVEADIKSADSGALYYSVPTPYLVPAGGKVLTYTTSNHTIAGFILVMLESPGVKLMGKAVDPADAISAVCAVKVAVEG